MSYILWEWWFLVLPLAVCTYSLVGLLSVWGGLGRPHWLLRLLPVGGVLGLGLTIPAYDLVVIFFAQTVVVIVALLLLRARRRRVQFSVRDLLLLCVVAAVVSAAAANAPADAWTPWANDGFPGTPGDTPREACVKCLLIGAAFGIITLVGAWVGLGKSRRRWRVIGLGLVLPSLPVAGWLLLFRTSRRLAGSLPRARLGFYTAVLGTTLVSLLILLPPAAVYVMLPPAVPVPTAPIPEPNGYDDLLAAGRALADAATLDIETATQQQLQAFVSKHRKVLATARTGLDRPCLVPLRYRYEDLFVSDIEQMWQLAGGFLAEGRLAEVEGRAADALRSYADIIRLGLAGKRGAIGYHCVVGYTLEGIGIGEIHKSRNELTPEECRQMITTLETLNADREPIGDVLLREAAWYQRWYGWVYQLCYVFDIGIGREDHLQLGVNNARKGALARMQLLTVELGLRIYFARHGDYPDELSELVPDHLSKLPMDPFSGEAFLYHRTAQGYELRSVDRFWSSW